MRNSPEVTVKVTSRSKSAATMRAHLAYISRHGELELETNLGDRLAGTAAVRELAEEWADLNRAHDTRGSNMSYEGAQSVSIILSMPPGSNSDVVRSAAAAFAHERFARYDFAFVLHTDTEHPHVHLAVRAVGDDMRRLQLNKGDLHDLRELFASKLRERGQDAEATPRAARGLEGRSDPTAIHRTKQREGEQPKAPPRKALVNRTRAANDDEHAWADSARIGLTATDKAMVLRQNRIRGTYTSAATALARSADPADRQLAVEVNAFVAAMPPVERTAYSNTVDQLHAHRTRLVERQAEQQAERTQTQDRASKMYEAVDRTGQPVRPTPTPPAEKERGPTGPPLPPGTDRER